MSLHSNSSNKHEECIVLAIGKYSSACLLCQTVMAKRNHHLMAYMQTIHNLIIMESCMYSDSTEDSLLFWFRSCIQYEMVLVWLLYSCSTIKSVFDFDKQRRLLQVSLHPVLLLIMGCISIVKMSIADNKYSCTYVFLRTRRL